MTGLILAALLLVPPPPVTAQTVPDRRPLHYALTAYGLASVADLSTTMYAMGQAPDAFREANPILGWTERRPVAHALVKGAFVAGTMFALSKLYDRHPRWAIVAAVGLAATSSYVTYRNAQLIRTP